MGEVVNKQTMLDMFLDSTSGESYRDNRLVTRDGDDGVELWGYGWLKLAVYNESDNEATVFTGHTSLNSQTVSRYLNDVVRRAEARGRNVVLSSESPTVDTPNEGVKFINNYISMEGRKSSVERAAQSEVRESLAHVA